MKVLCTICIRKNSKGIKNKNIKLINNIPLFVHTLIQAKNSNLFENIVVSTDSRKIMNISKKYGVEIFFQRPKFLSLDSSPKIPAIRHALLKSEKFFNKKFEIVIDLDVTSPLRNIFDIKKALKLFYKEQSNNLISVCVSKKNPYFNMIEILDKKIRLVKNINNKIFRRQDAPMVYDMNASIYIWKRRILLKSNNVFTKKTSVYIMPQERSIDIDTEFDFNIVKQQLIKNEKLFK